jgi:hypothetical protein
MSSLLVYLFVSWFSRSQKQVYNPAPVSADLVSAVSVNRGLPQPEKNGKIKEINIS